MELEKTGNDQTTVIRVRVKRIDAASAIQFKDAMAAEGKTAAARVILDLEEVDFLDSSGLGAVVAVKKLYAPDRELELAGLSPMVAKVFRLTRMDKVFAIHADAETALHATA